MRVSQLRSVLADTKLPSTAFPTKPESASTSTSTSPRTGKFASSTLITTALQGKQDSFDIGRTAAHGCVTEPKQAVLRAIFKLDPSGVGEGSKNGKILVNVSRPEK